MDTTFSGTLGIPRKLLQSVNSRDSFIKFKNGGETLQPGRITSVKFRVTFFEYFLRIFFGGGDILKNIQKILKIIQKMLPEMLPETSQTSFKKFDVCEVSGNIF